MKFELERFLSQLSSGKSGCTAKSLCICNCADCWRLRVSVLDKLGTKCSEM